MSNHPSAEDTVAELAGHYDERLIETTLRRLRERQALSGRVCQRCHEFKPLAQFGADRRDGMGLDRQCRTCRAARNAARPRAGRDS